MKNAYIKGFRINQLNAEKNYEFSVGILFWMWACFKDRKGWYSYNYFILIIKTINICGKICPKTDFHRPPQKKTTSCYAYPLGNGIGNRGRGAIDEFGVSKSAASSNQQFLSSISIKKTTFSFIIYQPYRMSIDIRTRLFNIRPCD